MPRERLSAGVRKDIVIEGVAKQAEIVTKEGQKMTVKARKGGKGRFGQPFPVTTRKFWEMADQAAS